MGETGEGSEEGKGGEGDYLLGSHQGNLAIAELGPELAHVGASLVLLLSLSSSEELERIVELLERLGQGLRFGGDFQAKFLEAAGEVGLSGLVCVD